MDRKEKRESGRMGRMMGGKSPYRQDQGRSNPGKTGKAKAKESMPLNTKDKGRPTKDKRRAALLERT